MTHTEVVARFGRKLLEQLARLESAESTGFPQIKVGMQHQDGFETYCWIRGDDPEYIDIKQALMDRVTRAEANLE